MIEEETPQPVFTELVNPSFCTGHDIDEACTEPHRHAVKCTSLNGTTCIVQGLYDGLQLTVQEYLDLKASPKYTYTKTPRKDYVIFVSNIDNFKRHLLEHEKQFISGSTVDDVKLNIPKTMVIGNVNGNTTAIARADELEYSYFNECEECDIIGEAKGQWITDVDSVHFYSKDDEAKYYSVYDIAPKYHEDENGDTIETIPPMLHGSLASKKQGIF